MRYMGSKNRYAKELLSIILKDRKDGQWYAEPFAGGCNVIDKVDGKRLASDRNEYLMEMFYALTLEEKFVEEIPKDVYDKARNQFNKNETTSFSDAEIGWIGFMASYKGRFFDGGYSGNYKKRDYIGEAMRNIGKQIPNLVGVEFSYGSYDDIHIPDDSIIYCDPPYNETKGYSKYGAFDSEKFWQWVREMTIKGHKVFVSEYNAPDDFECVWEKEVNNSLTKNTGSKKGVERLFIYKGGNND